ncbi:MAG: FkbM family methyltransferase [Verrucomicrobia bacterium]|nr:FkbM family methyltransferase [Verrucomicrobiota bacterium]
MPNFVRSTVQNIWIRYYFKFVLSKIKSTEIDGIKLDLTSLSLKVRNRILIGYEEAEKHICREFLSKDDCVLELGGGIGFIGLFCQKRLGIEKYVTIEANPQTIQLLERNYSLNGLIPQVLNYAISSAGGSVDLNVGGDFWEHCLTPKSKAAKTISVPAITLPELLERIPIQPNTLIIDVEGGERFINFREIPEEITKIIIEIHPVIIGRAAVQELINSLCERGFRIVCEEGDTLAFTKGC